MKKSRETIRAEIRAEILEEQRIQAELDEKVRKWNKTDDIVKAMHRASKLLAMSSNNDGVLWIYEGTFDAVMDIFRAMGYKDVQQEIEE